MKVVVQPGALNDLRLTKFFPCCCSVCVASQQEDPTFEELQVLPVPLWIRSGLISGCLDALELRA